MTNIEAAIRSPAYAYSRAHVVLKGGIAIYHRDPSMPRGVKMAASGPASEVNPILRAIRHNSPLSPTEGA